MAEAGEAPQLLVIGKRGWMNDNIVAMLDDCATIQPFVTEANGLSDGQIAAALSHSRAMLLPSFAEGLGIPMLEAKAAGLKVIASDLPALREIAADDTVFLNPLDGPGWRNAILAAAIP
ncbi:MAG: glycosyltransferase [Paracoccaceae bacterium]|nr:glycosyltransferase [Paracoccaceae bacterium]